MRNVNAAAAATVAVVLSLSLLLHPSITHAHNISLILAKYPGFTTFNNYLTLTNLASEINVRETITVCAVNNTGMSNLLAKHLTIGAIKNVLSLHVLLDYFDAEKLHEITDGSAIVATVYQATGSAAGTSGFVNITDLKGGKVGFSVDDDNNNNVVSATLVKPLESIPYNISVIQISTILSSPEAESPAPAPIETNLTSLMSSHNCKLFAENLLANSPAQQTFQSNIESGLTVFCPGDEAMQSFLPKFNNLTADDRQSLLEYHGVPIYDSLQGFRSSNGLTNTLATNAGGNKFDFTVQNDGNYVTIQTRIVTAKVVGTVIDDQPLAIFELDRVLMPVELFKADLPPAPAPVPAADAESPGTDRITPAPAVSSGSPNGEVADQNAKHNGAVRFDGGRFARLVLGTVVLCFYSFVLM